MQDSDIYIETPTLDTSTAVHFSARLEIGERVFEDLFVVGDADKVIAVYASEDLAKTPWPRDTSFTLIVLHKQQEIVHVQQQHSIEWSPKNSSSNMLSYELEATENASSTVGLCFYLESGRKAIPVLQIRGAPDESFFPPKPNYKELLGILSSVERLKSSTSSSSAPPKIPRHATKYLPRDDSQLYLNHIDVYMDVERYAPKHIRQCIDYEQKLAEHMRSGDDDAS